MNHLSDDPQRLRAALLEADGVITRAAKLLGTTKPYTMNLVRRFALNEWARTLRRQRGLPSTGRFPRPIAADQPTA